MEIFWLIQSELFALHLIQSMSPLTLYIGLTTPFSLLQLSVIKSQIETSLPFLCHAVVT